jgi:hypothetical protein
LVAPHYRRAQLRFNFPRPRRCGGFEDCGRHFLSQVGFGTFNPADHQFEPHARRDIAHGRKDATGRWRPQRSASEQFLLFDLGPAREPDAVHAIGTALEKKAVSLRDAIDALGHLLHLALGAGNGHRATSPNTRGARIAAVAALMA